MCTNKQRVAINELGNNCTTLLPMWKKNQNYNAFPYKNYCLFLCDLITAKQISKYKSRIYKSCFWTIKIKIIYQKTATKISSNFQKIAYFTCVLHCPRRLKTDEFIFSSELFGIWHVPVLYFYKENFNRKIWLHKVNTNEMKISKTVMW